MSACHAARPRGALSLVSEESSSSRGRHSCAVMAAGDGPRKSSGQTVRSKMAATVKARSRPSRCSVGPGKCPGRRDQPAPQDGHDWKPAVPRLDQAPDAGDRDIGKDRGNHVGGGRQCPRQHGRAAIRRTRRRPGYGHRFPPSRAADGTRRVLAPPVPPGQLDCCQRPWLSRGREWPEGSRIGPLCAGRLAMATLPRLGYRSRPDRAHGVGAVRVVAAFLPPTQRAILASRARGSALPRTTVTFVLCHTIRRPLCPFSTFLVSDLDRPFCHPVML